MSDLAEAFASPHSHDLQLPHQTPPSARVRLFIPSIRFNRKDGSHKPHMRVISGPAEQKYKRSKEPSGSIRVNGYAHRTMPVLCIKSALIVSILP